MENSFIEKTYVVGTHWSFVPTTFVTENKDENYLERTSVYKACFTATMNFL